MQRYRILLFRQFAAERTDHQPIEFETHKALELFCYLLVHRSRPHTRDHLACLLWQKSPRTQARQYLRQTLWQLQSTLNQASSGDTALILVDQDWIHARLSHDVYLDIADFENTYALVRGIQGRALDTNMAAALETAVKLYRGDLLENWYNDWCLFERERLQNIYLAMLDKLMGYHAFHERFEIGTLYGNQILEYDRAHERTYRRLMRLHYLAGDRTSALRQFERCEQILRDELNVEPSRRTIELHQQLVKDRLIPPHRDIADDIEPFDTPASLASILKDILRTRRTLIQTQLQLEDALDTVIKLVSEKSSPLPPKE